MSKLPFNTRGDGTKVVIRNGIANAVTVWLTAEITIGKLLGCRELRQALRYDLHNLWIRLDGYTADCETYIGASDCVISLEKAACHKAAITPRELKDKLQRFASCCFHKDGANHELWRRPDGRIFPIPRHARDLSTGTLAKIIKQAGLNIGVSAFLQL